MFPAPNDEPAWPFWAAFAALIIGWVPCDTFFTTVGALQLHFHFFDLASVIARPARLAIGVNRGDAWTIPFGILCIAAIAATVAPRYSSRRAAQWGPCAPLALMLICGALFYRAATADTFVAASDAGAVGVALAKLGNALAGRASAVAARHISVGLGLLLSFPAASYLAYGSLRVVREPQSDMLPGSSL
ncbi:MAG: hypothetical protein ABJC66_08980 [Gammaproteobacteria bacterium]